MRPPARSGGFCLMVAVGGARGRTSGDDRSVFGRTVRVARPARPNPERSGPTGEGARESRRRQETWRQR
ncbi:hypothetical protein CO709_26095 [Burkholderia thailandensis]|nr:hypothetical protein CO709_26095 [Burkholderia thailandensis]